VSQLDLFGAPPAGTGDDLAAVRAEAAQLAERINPRIRLGTSSWTFPGWRGIVYSRSLTQTALAREGLREYARHPLMRTVGIDRSFYAPIPDDAPKETVELPTVMIGRELAGKLLVDRGDIVRLMSPRFSASPMGAMPRSKRFVVAAIFDPFGNAVHTATPCAP